MTEELLQQAAADPGKVLNRGYRIKQRIASREERIQKWRDMAVSITASTENGPGGGGYPTSKIENCVAHIAEIQETLAEEISGLMQCEADAAALIQELSSKPNYKAVLELRYLNNMTYEQISAAMSYTFRWTQELLKRAVSDIQEQARAMLNADVRNSQN